MANRTYADLPKPAERRLRKHHRPIPGLLPRNDTFYWAKKDTVDVWGNDESSIPDNAVLLKGKIDAGNSKKPIMFTQGTEQTKTAFIIIRGHKNVEIGDVLYYENPFGEIVKFKPRMVEPIYDLQGNAYQTKVTVY